MITQKQAFGKILFVRSNRFSPLDVRTPPKLHWCTQWFYLF